MMRRNGGLGKVIAGVLLFFGAVYIIYLYNDLSGQLKNTERTAERYRREQESVSNQLQVQYDHIGRLGKSLQKEKLKYKASLDDLTASKNELKQRCDNDKTEMTNRLNSLNQQHKMLKSQHDDIESEFGRLQSEHEREGEEHKRLDEERNLEYNQFKQEKILEISNLRDTVANFEREKEQLNEEITKLKQQLQNSLHQTSQDKQTISQLEQQVQQQKNETLENMELENVTAELQIQQEQGAVQDLQSRLSQAQFQIQQDVQTIQGYQARLTQAQNLVQQAQQQQHIPQQQQQQQQQQFVPQQQQQQGGLQQGQNVQQGAAGGQLNFNPQQIVDGGLNQQNAVFQPVNNGLQQQGVFQQQQQPLVAAQNQVNLPNEGMNIADEILESLKDKHKPLDADEVEEQQKQHQILPPIDHKALNEDKEASKEGQGVRDHVVEGAHKDDHDNRMENQGPVGLQVQEPRMKPVVDNQQDGGGNLLFRPKVPEVLDNQIQPHMPVDDSLKQEQMVKPMNFGEQQADHMNQIDRDDNLEHDEDEEEDGKLGVPVQQEQGRV